MDRLVTFEHEEQVSGFAIEIDADSRHGDEGRKFRKCVNFSSHPKRFLISGFYYHIRRLFKLIYKIPVWTYENEEEIACPMNPMRCFD